MKLRSSSPKTKSVQDLKTAESHSSLGMDCSTRIKRMFLPEQYTKLKKQYKLDNKPKPIAAKMGKIAYKCGCIQRNYQVRPSININVDVKNPLSNKRFESKSRNKSSDSLKPLKPKPKVQRSTSLNNILLRLNNLCQDYEDLMKQETQRSRKFSVIKYVPKQVIKSIDKIKRVERPIELKVKKIKKIPKEIIKYKDVEKHIPLYKQELIFVDPVPLEPVTKHVNIHRQIIKEIQTQNHFNNQMKSNLMNLQWRREKYGGEINMSLNEIEQLRSQILEAELRRSKSIDLLTQRKQQYIAVSEFKIDMNTSIDTGNVNNSNDDNILIRSKSQPLKTSILTYKSRLLVNGKEESQNNRNIGSFRHLMIPTSQSIVHTSSSPQIQIQQTNTIISSQVLQFYNFKVHKI